MYEYILQLYCTCKSKNTEFFFLLVLPNVDQFLNGVLLSILTHQKFICIHILSCEKLALWTYETYKAGNKYDNGDHVECNFQVSFSNPISFIITHTHAHIHNCTFTDDPLHTFITVCINIDYNGSHSQKIILTNIHAQSYVSS